MSEASSYEPESRYAVLNTFFSYCRTSLSNASSSPFAAPLDQQALLARPEPRIGRRASGRRRRVGRAAVRTNGSRHSSRAAAIRGRGCRSFPKHVR
jgi:hypothetical protein